MNEKQFQQVTTRCLTWSPRSLFFESTSTSHSESIRERLGLVPCEWEKISMSTQSLTKSPRSSFSGRHRQRDKKHMGGGMNNHI